MREYRVSREEAGRVGHRHGLWRLPALMQAALIERSTIIHGRALTSEHAKHFKYVRQQVGTSRCFPVRLRAGAGTV